MTQASAPTVTGWQTPATSPYQDRRWYAAAGLLDQVTVLAAGSDQRPVSLPVWRVEPDAHYYHVPRNLLGGHREAPFLAGGPIQPLELHARDWGQSLVTVSPYGYHGGPAHSTGSDPAAFGELADQLLELAERHDVGCVLSHYLFEDRDAAWIDALVARGGVPLVLGADCHLELSWTSTEDYLAGFGSSRRAVRRAHAGMHRSGLARLARRAAGTGPGERAAAALFGEYTATFDPQHGPPASLLGAVAEGRELDRVLFSVADNGGDARSVMAALVHGDVLYPKFFGTSRPRRDYFALAYCQLIEYAIAEGYRRIEFGGGTHQAKLFRGGRLRFALGVLFVRDRALRGAALAAGHQLSAAKISHFQTLAERWQIDHRAPPAPAIFSRPAGQRTSAPPNAER